MRCRNVGRSDALSSRVCVCVCVHCQPWEVGVIRLWEFLLALGTHTFRYRSLGPVDAQTKLDVEDNDDDDDDDDDDNDDGSRPAPPDESLLYDAQVAVARSNLINGPTTVDDDDDDERF